MSVLRVPARFNGPPDVVNGGYACASVAAVLDGVAQVTLRRPVPVDTDLELRRDGDGATLLAPDGELLAEAVPSQLDLATPRGVSIDAANSAMQRTPARTVEQGGFPCFVCSPSRADGFLVTPGPVEGRNAVAAVWRPDAALAAEDGRVAERFVWAVLDCTGSFGAMVAHDVLEGVLLGRMAAQIDQPVLVGETYVAVGWADAADGRKLPAGAALFRDGSEPVARARLLTFPPKR